MIRKYVAAAQIEKWEESHECQHLPSPLQRTHFTTVLIAKRSKLCFYCTKCWRDPGLSIRPFWLESTQALQATLRDFFFYIFYKTLSCWLSVIVAHRHAQMCNIKTGTKHKSTYLCFAQRKRCQLLCRGLRSRIKEPLWGIVILAAFPCCIWSCAKTYGTITCFVMSSQHQFLFLASLVIQNVCDSEFEISAGQRSFTLCIVKQSQHVGHLIFQL